MKNNSDRFSVTFEERIRCFRGNLRAEAWAHTRVVSGEQGNRFAEKVDELLNAPIDTPNLEARISDLRDAITESIFDHIDAKEVSQ